MSAGQYTDGVPWQESIVGTLGWNRPRPRRNGCPCGCGGDGSPPGDRLRMAPEPAGDDGDWEDYGGQPGAVLLSRAYAQRDADPLTVYENARDEAAARHADTTTDGRAALAGLRSRRNPDGSRLSGTAALAVVRAMADLGIGGVGHEPS